MLQNLGALGALPLQSGVVTRQITPGIHRREGGSLPLGPGPDDPFLPHSGAALDLGKGWKVRPFIALAVG